MSPVFPVSHPAQAEADSIQIPKIDPGQDVVTASDGAGGYLSTRDILLIVLIVFAVIGLAAVL